MRHLRPFPALIALAIIGAACSSSSPGASTGGDQSQAAQQSQGGGASQGGQASQPAASTGGGGGGGANGSITYNITGDYTASGELPFVNAGGVSAFAGTGWAAFFYEGGNTDVVIDLTTIDAAHAITFGDTNAVLTGFEANGCTFNLEKNDASGLKGSVECHGAQLIMSEAGTLGTADLSAHWEAHP
jgi:hypothetical protein